MSGGLPEPVLVHVGIYREALRDIAVGSVAPFEVSSLRDYDRDADQLGAERQREGTRQRWATSGWPRECTIRSAAGRLGTA